MSRPESEELSRAKWRSELAKANFMTVKTCTPDEAALMTFGVEVDSLEQENAELRGLLRKGQTLVSILAESDEDDRFVHGVDAFLSCHPAKTEEDS